MKHALLIFAVGILTTFASAAPPYDHTKTGISLPDTLAGLTRGDVTPYETAPGEAGVAIPYHGEEVEVTVFIRQIDPKKITSPAMIVEESLATVKQMEAAGTYSNVKLYRSADKSETTGWSKGAYTARANQAFVMSFIYATIRDEYAVKARITTANPKNDSIPKFVSEFQKIVDEAKPKP